MPGYSPDTDCRFFPSGNPQKSVQKWSRNGDTRTPFAFSYAVGQFVRRGPPVARVTVMAFSVFAGINFFLSCKIAQQLSAFHPYKVKKKENLIKTKDRKREEGSLETRRYLPFLVKLATSVSASISFLRLSLPLVDCVFLRQP